MTRDRKWMLLSFAATLGPFVLVIASVGYLVHNQSITRSILRAWIDRHEEMHRVETADQKMILRELEVIADRLGDRPPRDRKESE